MPALLAAALIVVVVVVSVLVIKFVLAFVAAHFVLLAAGLIAFLAGGTAIARAISRGADRRAAWKYPKGPPARLPAPPRRPQLPGVAPRAAIFAPPVPQPFAGGAYEDYAEHGPVIEAVVLPPRAEPIPDPCEGPGCGVPLPEDPWQLGLTESPDDRHPADVHSFCSRKCLDRWAMADQAKRAEAWR